MYQVVGGLRPLAPGYRRVLVAPEPGGGIDRAETALETPHGLLSCAWETDGRRLRIDFTVPKTVRAKLRPPPGWEPVADGDLDDFGPGDHVFEARR
jgi:alpha-L-rhamnosidase